ncbi:dehydrogenase/reductase SDR family member 12-like [Lycorma delicatula]|uniref:dehydrogenase/reductase SDR family member 12-like n=1 Tax=Lycorma delicatula TaxID=130591 RepID=UPI003F50D8E7
MTPAFTASKPFYILTVVPYILELVVLAEIYSREYPNIFCASMHPGWVDTDGMKESMPEFYNQMKDRLRTPKQGADTVVWLALAERPINNTSGLFLSR